MVTVFGEVLWDIFDDKKEIGGAPFNFAVQLVRQGIPVQLVSAVGKDALGEETLKIIEEFGVGTRNVALTDQPTGYCRVTLKDGTPEYELAMPVAYDFIEAPECSGDVLYFGTLAQRGAYSAKSLNKLLAGKYKDIFFDINIRQHYYSDTVIDESLKAATIMKISREEIGVLGITGSEEEICSKLTEKYPNLKKIIVTLDKDGAFVYSDGDICYSEKPGYKVVSTVGAGDAFSAGFLTGYLQGLQDEDCIKLAMKLAGEACGRLGAL